MSGAPVPDPRPEAADLAAVPAEGAPAEAVQAEGASVEGAGGTPSTEAARADEGAPAPRGFPGFPAGDPRQLPLAQRPRGLDAPPPPGGGDPELKEALARERPYMRLLIGMIALIVGGSLILTFLALISAAILR